MTMTNSHRHCVPNSDSPTTLVRGTPPNDYPPPTKRDLCSCTLLRCVTCSKPYRSTTTALGRTSSEDSSCTLEKLSWPPENTVPSTGLSMRRFELTPDCITPGSRSEYAAWAARRAQGDSSSAITVGSSATKQVYAGQEKSRPKNISERRDRLVQTKLQPIARKTLTITMRLMRMRKVRSMKHIHPARSSRSLTTWNNITHGHTTQKSEFQGSRFNPECN